MSLEDELVNLDSESGDELEELYRNCADTAEFASDLISLTRDEFIQSRSSWLLKRYFEDGGELSDEENSGFWRVLPKLVEWQAKLHILQSFSFVKMDAVEQTVIEDFLRENLGSGNKFVRAWSYNGFCLLADVFPEYRKEADQLIENAMLTESASVKARLRNARKIGFLSEKHRE